MDRLVSVVMACTLAGCSLGISAPAANRKRYQMPDCDTGKGLVALDALAAVGLGIGGLAALGEDEGVGAVALVGAALFTAAALHGSGNADRCREAIADYGREMASGPATAEVRRPRRAAPDPEPEERPQEPSGKPKAPKVPPPDEEPEPATPPAPPKPPKQPAFRDWSQFWREVP